MRRNIVFTAILTAFISCFAQDISDFEAFRKGLIDDYQKTRADIYRRFDNMRDSLNAEYASFLRNAWGRYKENSAVPRPKDEPPLPPIPYQDDESVQPVDVKPREMPLPQPLPQPLPIEPIKETPLSSDRRTDVPFYGITESVRVPDRLEITLNSNSNQEISRAWEKLNACRLDNTIYDCLRVRDSRRLGDWAYLQFLNRLADRVCGDGDAATLLTAYLFANSGYQMRLAISGDELVLLFGSHHQIYDKSYYVVDGTTYYPLKDVRGSIIISPAKFAGEKPISLIMESVPLLGNSLSSGRKISSKKYPEMEAAAHVMTDLIEFYDTYPSSAYGGNLLTRWATYASTPLSDEAQRSLYPALRNALAGCTPLEEVNRLLNWVQTGFVYEYDEKVWGHDRAFFPEETLYYPFSDCEDRAILFSRLVRDLLGLDVALVYYPGHLATAVMLGDDASGDAMIIDGRRFLVCDPTYSGAPAGKQMSVVDGSKAQAILLTK